MWVYTRKLNKKYALDICALHVYRNIKEGLTVFSYALEADWYKDDHKPSLRFQLVLLNVMLIEIDVYNMHHLKESEEDQT